MVGTGTEPPSRPAPKFCRNSTMQTHVFPGLPSHFGFEYSYFCLRCQCHYYLDQHPLPSGRISQIAGIRNLIYSSIYSKSQGHFCAASLGAPVSRLSCVHDWAVALLRSSIITFGCAGGVRVLVLQCRPKKIRADSRVTNKVD